MNSPETLTRETKDFGLTEYRAMICSTSDSQGSEEILPRIPTKRRRTGRAHEENVYNVTLVVGDKRIPAIKEILTLNSVYFAALFNGGFSESGRGEVKLVESLPEAFEQMLAFVPPHGRPTFDHNNSTFEQILSLADKYALDCVTNTIEAYFRKSLSEDTWSFYLHAAVAFNLHDLTCDCFRLFYAAFPTTQSKSAAAPPESAPSSSSARNSPITVTGGGGARVDSVEAKPQQNQQPLWQRLIAQSQVLSLPDHVQAVLLKCTSAFSRLQQVSVIQTAKDDATSTLSIHNAGSSPIVLQICTGGREMNRYFRTLDARSTIRFYASHVVVRLTDTPLPFDPFIGLSSSSGSHSSPAPLAFDEHYLNTHGPLGDPL